jgi:dCMP deaminase
LGTAQDSNCTVLKVGAVLLREGKVVSVGRSGGGTNSCGTCPKGIDIRRRSAEAGVRMPSPTACAHDHAEVNALAKAQEGDDLLITVSPCLPCAEQMTKKGINRVVFLDDWIPGRPITKAIRYFRESKESGVRIRQAGHRPDSPNN